MSTSQSSKLISVVQLNCNLDKERNWSIAKDLIQRSSKDGAQMVFLPECTDFIAKNQAGAFANSESLDGNIVSRYRNLAKELSIWLSLCVHERNEKLSKDKILNAHLVIDSLGEIKSVYHKLHLFNLETETVRLIESESFIPGSKIVTPVDTPVGKVGLGICYDLRFPELSIAYAKARASILTYPASFTVPTGTYHWQPLLQARAIENQCYVVAAAQTGHHHEKRESYGHAMIVDPWGKVLADCGTEVGYKLATVDEQWLATCRSKLPIWTDRRYDLYANIKPASD